MRAIDGYDPDRGIKLSTYSVIWITQALRHSLAQNSRLVSVPVARHHLLVKIHSVKKILRQAGVNNIKMEDFAFLLDKPLKSIEKAMVKETHTSHFEDVVYFPSMKSSMRDSATRTKADIIGSDSKENDRVQELEDMQRDLISLLHEVLDPEELEIVSLKYGLDANVTSPLNTKSISERLNMSAEEVNKIHYRAIRKLRKRKQIQVIQTDNE